VKEKHAGASSGRPRPCSPGMKMPGWCTACVTTNASIGHLPVGDQPLAPARPSWDPLLSPAVFLGFQEAVT